MQAGEESRAPISEQHLTVVGAGPKAVSIAAKRRVLSHRDVVVPRLDVIDPQGVAAHWTGQHGYTDGHAPLGTPPEKDIGFPYASTNYGGPDANDAVNQAMTQFSWMAFRIQNGPYSYADWVDRGKPPPSHGHWADYLQWVAERVDLDITQAELSSISVCDDRWRLSLDSGHVLDTNGLVLTSPGPPRALHRSGGQIKWLYDGQDFWLPDSQREIKEQFSDDAQQPIRACVIGGGETAAAIVVQLTHLLPRETPIDIVSKDGIVYTRGESHDENRLYSQPERWLEFPNPVRKEFVKRTDRGVFSVTNKETLNRTYGVETIAGHVTEITASVPSILVHFDEGPSRGYELVVDATGFRPDWFLDLMDDGARARLSEAAVGVDR